jgi:hypothetical protein
MLAGEGLPQRADARIDLRFRDAKEEPKIGANADEYD